MANTDKTPTTAPADEFAGTTLDATEAAKPGRKQVRDPEGRNIGAFFSGAEAAHIREARFVKRFDKDSDVIRAAVAAYLSDIPTPSE